MIHRGELPARWSSGRWGGETTALEALLPARGLPLPDGALGPTPGTPSGTLILSAEDAADDTIVPRLEAAGANRSYIVQVPAVALDDYQRPPVLPTDLQLLRQAVEEAEWELC